MGDNYCCVLQLSKIRSCAPFLKKKQRGRCGFSTQQRLCRNKFVLFCFGFLFFFFFFFYLFILFIHETKHIYNIIMIEVIAIKEKYNRSAFKRFTIVTLILFNPKLRPCIPLFLFFYFCTWFCFLFHCCCWRFRSRCTVKIQQRSDDAKRSVSAIEHVRSQRSMRSRCVRETKKSNQSLASRDGAPRAGDRANARCDRDAPDSRIVVRLGSSRPGSVELRSANFSSSRACNYAHYRVFIQCFYIVKNRSKRQNV